MLAISHAVVALMLFGLFTLGAPVWAGNSLVLEVFTTVERSVTGDEDERLRTASVTTYAVDGIERFESTLSEGLPADPETAKAVALRQIQQIEADLAAPAKTAAIGLAKAIQYGVDRYPAIVFDGQAVVYGVTDVQIALAHYRTWRREGKR